MLWQILLKLEPAIEKIYRRVSQPPPPNLLGDRDIEYSWIASRIPGGPGRGMELGCGKGFLSFIAARRGFKMTAIDLAAVNWAYSHPDLNFVHTDIFDFTLEDGSLDLIICCSSIEHVGLGRYGDRPDRDADLRAMGRLRGFLKSEGVMLLTIPVGRDTVIGNRHRVYGHERVPRLLDGYVAQEKEYWVKDLRNRWVLAEEDTALRRPPSAWCYGLGCFALRRTGGARGS